MSQAQTDSVRRRFYRFFQFARLDSKPAARVVVELLGLGGKPWVLAIDRTNWDFVLRLIFGSLIRAAERWKSIKVTEFERRQMAAVKKELNQEYETQVGLDRKSLKATAHTKISGSSQT